MRSARSILAAALAVATLAAVPAPAPAGIPASGGTWLAGDLHIHTCYSHDAWCPADDYNTEPTDAYTLSGSVEERFIEASARGMDYLAITDHCSWGNLEDCGQRSVEDPGFGTHGVIGVPGYENSIDGHAQMLGATHVFDPGTGAAGINAMADALRAEGGAFQANHPGGPSPTCADTGAMYPEASDWGYGYDVRVDMIEVWNGTYGPRPSFWWECWMSRGAHVAATGGSDSHWLSTTAVQGPGNPTTWVFATEPSAAGVLAGLRAGRTAVTARPPVELNVVLLIEADADGDGVFESMIGDTVPGGVEMRARVLGTPTSGIVRIRANGYTLDDLPLIPGDSVTFRAPDGPGWVRAELDLPEGSEARDAACDAVYPKSGKTLVGCTDRLLTQAITSAIYLS